MQTRDRALPRDLRSTAFARAGAVGWQWPLDGWEPSFWLGFWLRRTLRCCSSRFPFAITIYLQEGKNIYQWINALKFYRNKRKKICTEIFLGRLGAGLKNNESNYPTVCRWWVFCECCRSGSCWNRCPFFYSGNSPFCLP